MPFYLIGSQTLMSYAVDVGVAVVLTAATSVIFAVIGLKGFGITLPLFLALTNPGTRPRELRNLVNLGLNRP